MARYNFGKNNRNYTEFGWKVLNVHKAKNGRLYAVIERPLAKDFVVGRGYDVTDGRWAQGEYGFKTRKQANNRAKYLSRRKNNFWR